MTDHREDMRRTGATARNIQRVVNRTARQMYERRAKTIDGYDWKWAHATEAVKRRWRSKAVTSLDGFIDKLLAA